MINVNEVGEDGEGCDDDCVYIHVDIGGDWGVEVVEEKRDVLAVGAQEGEVYIRTLGLRGLSPSMRPPARRSQRDPSRDQDVSKVSS